jgi:hypothetical protein
MFWVSSCVETARFGPIVVVGSIVVKGMMTELAAVIPDFGKTYIPSCDVYVKASVRSKSLRRV